MKKNLFVLLAAGILAITATSCKDKPTEEPSHVPTAPKVDTYKSDDLDMDGNPKQTRPPTEEGDFAGYNTRIGELKVHFIDVGQADCTLIQMPDGTNFLIDGGNRADAEDLKKYFLEIGVTRINAIIATHPHEDHIGALPAIIEAYDVGTVYMPDIDDEYLPTTMIYEEFVDTLIDNKVNVKIPKMNESIYKNNKHLSEFNIIYNGSLGEDDYNTYSLVARLQYGGYVFMFTGDADKDVEEYIISKNKKNEEYLDCDILKAAHHGSNTANCKEWIDILTPSYIFIPCEVDNEYHHPHPSTMKTFKSSGAKIYDMRESGTCLITTDGVDLNVYEHITGEYPLGSENYGGEIELPY